jgi:hypothetical protein
MMSVSTSPANTPLWLHLVDGHVHYYPCFSPRVFLDQALKNFHRAAEAHAPCQWGGYLLLADRQGQQTMDTFLAAHDAGELTPWTIMPTDEPGSCVFHWPGNPPLFLIRGRQVVSAERIELLGLGCLDDLPDGLGIDEALRRLLDAGALVVLPWGFGKWWFGRRRVVERLLGQHARDSGTGASALHVGDNAGRPACCGIPPLFAQAQARGIRVLPGSDPLPLESQVCIVGKLGFVLRGPLDWKRPSAGVKYRLQDGSQPETFGRTANLWTFCRNQVLLLMRP